MRRTQRNLPNLERPLQECIGLVVAALMKGGDAQIVCQIPDGGVTRTELLLVLKHTRSELLFRFSPIPEGGIQNSQIESNEGFKALLVIRIRSVRMLESLGKHSFGFIELARQTMYDCQI